MAIYLIRHGQTDGNARRVLQMPETPLSDRGHEQARRLAERLVGAGIKHILASDYARAEMTARAVESVTRASLEFDPVLQERNFGDLRGTPYADLETDPFAPDYEPPGGESWGVFHERVDVAWARVRALAARVDGHLAVVTHGLVCHSITERLVELPPSLGGGDAAGSARSFPNTALTVIEERAPHRVSLFGCAAHLEGLPDTPATGAA